VQDPATRKVFCFCFGLCRHFIFAPACFSTASRPGVVPASAPLSEIFADGLTYRNSFAGPGNRKKKKPHPIRGNPPDAMDRVRDYSGRTNPKTRAWAQRRFRAHTIGCPPIYPKCRGRVFLENIHLARLKGHPGSTPDRRHARRAVTTRRHAPPPPGPGRAGRTSLAPVAAACSTPHGGALRAGSAA